MARPLWTAAHDEKLAALFKSNKVSATALDPVTIRKVQENYFPHTKIKNTFVPKKVLVVEPW